MHPPTPASFGVYQQDIVNLNHELEALSSDWSKNAQTRFPPREIAVIYVKQIQRSDERLLAQNMATAIRSITNERPILFVSFIGDSLAEFIVTKRHRDLLIAVIRTRRGILLGDIDPVFGQLRRDGLPPIISSKQYQNAIQCLKLSWFAVQSRSLRNIRLLIRTQRRCAPRLLGRQLHRPHRQPLPHYQFSKIMPLHRTINSKSRLPQQPPERLPRSIPQ